MLTNSKRSARPLFLNRSRYLEVIFPELVANPDPKESTKSGPYYCPPAKAVAVVYERA